MAVGKSSKSQEAYAARYKTYTFAANRKKKLERVLKAQPNNTQVVNALADIHYRRKTPNTTVWSASAKAEKVLVTEMAKASDVKIPTDTISAKQMFKLKTRLKVGNQMLFSESKTLVGLN